MLALLLWMKSQWDWEPTRLPGGQPILQLGLKAQLPQTKRGRFSGPFCLLELTGD